MATERGFTPSELMVCAAARELRDGDVVFVGIGLPSLACNLALRTHAPNLELIYESGVVGARPTRLPDSIGDPANLPIKMEILRAGAIAFAADTSTRRIVRSFADLIGYLGRDNLFPDGVVLLTGTGIVPPDDFTLQAGDEVVISIEGIGTLRNPVVQGA